MKIRTYFWFLLLLVPVTASAAPSILPGGVVNPASFVPQGLPTYGIAQGSIVTVFGSGLGPAAIVHAGTFPLPTTLPAAGGTSVQITAGGNNFSAFMIYASDGQVAAILPSTVPVGPASLTVTFNGQVSNVAPFRVVQSNFGVFTANQQGTGPAVVQNYLSGASQPYNNIITPAQAGQAEILWGTGLGPYSGAENVAPTAAQASPIGNDVQVLVGGQSAVIQYNGRTPCCAGEDEIVFAVPAGVTGCYVPVEVSVNGVLSNAGTMAISSAPGASCAGANSFQASLVPLLQSKANVNIAGVQLIRQDQQVTQGGATTELTADNAQGNFVSVSSASILASPELSGAYLSPGYCGLYTFAGNDGDPQDQVQLQATFLNTGSPLTVSGPNGAKQVPQAGPGQFSGTLGVSLGNPALYFSPGAYTAAAAAGTGVGAFQGAGDFSASPFTWTNRGSINNVPLNQNLQITWSGGDANSEVIVNGYSATAANSAGTGFICVAGNGAGQLTVPSSLLATLPPSTGILTVIDRNSPSTFQATGLDLGSVTSDTRFDKLMTYGGGTLANCPNSIPLIGTATALSGTIPPSCLNALDSNINLTGGVPVSLTGTTANGQTVYKGTVAGNGALTCPNGTAGNWTANFPLTVTVTPTVGSLATNGGTLSGSYTFNGNTAPSLTFCGGPNQFGGLAMSSSLTGTVAPGGTTALSLGNGGGGGSGVVLTGTALALNGVVLGSGQLFEPSPSDTGSVALSLTGTTANNQTTYTGGGNGGGTVSCTEVTGANTVSNWTGTVTLNLTVAPSVSSLATSGGNLSGTGAFSLTFTACGVTQTETGITGTPTGAGAMTGTVAAGGAVTIEFGG